MKHDWYQASAGDLIANIWLANPLKVALLSSAYVPNRDTHKLFSDVSAAQITGQGYTAGGQALTGKSKNYDAAADRTNLLAADNVWPDSTFSTAYAVVYDDSGGEAALERSSILRAPRTSSPGCSPSTGPPWASSM